jgi:hypothetical protein
MLQVGVTHPEEAQVHRARAPFDRIISLQSCCFEIWEHVVKQSLYLQHFAVPWDVIYHLQLLLLLQVFESVTDQQSTQALPSLGLL